MKPRMKASRNTNILHGSSVGTARKALYLFLFLSFWVPPCVAVSGASTETSTSNGPEPRQRQARYRLKSSIAQAPDEWRRLHRAPADQVVDVAIGIVQGGFGALEETLRQVSSPQHANYGKHLSSREIHQLLQPAPESVLAVRQWLTDPDSLRDANITASAGDDWLELTMSVASLETLLQTEYWVFRHEPSGTSAVRSLAWSLPAHLMDVIDVVTPSNVFLRPTAQFKYGAPPPDWETQGRMPTHEELVEEDRLDRGHLEIPSQEDLSADPTAAEACNRLAVSPLCLRVLYGTWGYRASPSRPASRRGGHGPENSVGIVNFLGEVANRSDIALYLSRYRPDAASAHAEADFTVELVNGGDDQQTRNTAGQMARKKGYEGALDAQTVLGISWPVPLVTYNVGGKPPFRPLRTHAQNTNEPYLAWLRYMRGVEHPPGVISISYAEDEKLVPVEYARRVCAEFALLGLRGVSVLVASGDWGVGREKQCVRMDDGGDDNNKDSHGERRRFMPSFPAGCPYVTAVGATRLVPAPVGRTDKAQGQTTDVDADKVIEMVAFDARSKYASGGGFSDVFAQPAYQRDAVAAYLSHLAGTAAHEAASPGAVNASSGYDGLFDPRGRAYPDISAVGYHFSVLWDAVAHLQDGTSASTPTVAAIIALVNDALAAAGRPPLGFLNPWLYSAAGPALRDVTHGSNMGCNTSGFPAATGWDPATGLGTPWFPKMKELALASRFRATRPWYYLPGV
ncbi:hypothetical protein E4U21_002830 [Claviceps maximensis]|nr:hypothetical protein E4U21_002830 [Claviceps maximensis]